MCSAVCLTGEEEQSAPDTKYHHREMLSQSKKALWVDKKQYFTTEEGQSVMCGLFKGCLWGFFFSFSASVIPYRVSNEETVT